MVVTSTAVNAAVITALGATVKVPLVSPGPRQDEDEKPHPTEAEVFVAKTVQRGESFRQALGRFVHKARTSHVPLGLKQLGHDIWYGTQPKRRIEYKPLNRWKWLWGSYKPKPRTLAEAYRWRWRDYPKKRNR